MIERRSDAATALQDRLDYARHHRAVAAPVMKQNAYIAEY